MLDQRLRRWPNIDPISNWQSVGYIGCPVNRPTHLWGQLFRNPAVIKSCRPNDGPPVAHHRMPPVASGGPPHRCPADSGWPTSYIVCRWWTTGGSSVAIMQWQIPTSDCSLCATGGPPVVFLPLIATGGPLE